MMKAKKHIKKWHYAAKIIVFFILGLCLLVLLFGDALITQDPYFSDANQILSPPDKTHILGCDHLGRDLYSRIIKGVQSSLSMALLGVSINFFVGTLLGTLAGYLEHGIGQVIMGLADMMLGFPGLVLSIAVVGVLGPGVFNTLIALTVSGWAEFSRLARVLVLGEKKKEYLHTAKLNGAGHVKILLRYIFPNIFSQLLIFTFVSLGSFILRFSGLSFLGLGFQPPKPELGLILSEAKNFMQLAPFYMIYPGLALFLMVFAFNFYADILRDRLDMKEGTLAQKGD